MPRGRFLLGAGLLSLGMGLGVGGTMIATDDDPEIIRQPLPLTQEQIDAEPFPDELGSYTTQCDVVYAGSSELIGVIWGNHTEAETAEEMPEQYVSQFGPEAEIADCGNLHEYHSPGIFRY